jgi:hypothetical protein
VSNDTQFDLIEIVKEKVEGRQELLLCEPRREFQNLTKARAGVNRAYLVPRIAAISWREKLKVRRVFHWKSFVRVAKVSLRVGQESAPIVNSTAKRRELILRSVEKVATRVKYLGN